MAYLSLRDYGLIGNQGSAALVSRLGSIDWCCLPHLDSPSHFGALLDENQGGTFQIHPLGDYRSEQSYTHRSNLLETRFETPTGRGVLTDWMPTLSESPREPMIYRRVEMLEGKIQWSMGCTPRFGYGAEDGHAEVHRGGILFRGSTPGELALLQASVPIRIHSSGKSAAAQFKLATGDSVRFSWLWGRHGRIEEHPNPAETVQYWEERSHPCAAYEPGLENSSSARCFFAGPWHDTIKRSSLVIKLMAADFSGSIAESITTSLPSLSGGSRNWDYRYTWLRDCAMSIQGIGNLGYTDEAEAYFKWISDIVIRDGAEGLQPVYTLDGGRYLPERELAFLSGYNGARPVRIGNLSARQFHLDIYGHVMLAAGHHYERTRALPEGLWPKLKEIADYVSQAWRRPDRGPWEVRSKPEHFVASKVLCWVALDQACKLGHLLGDPPPPRWDQERETLHRTICEQGYDTQKRSFVRSFGERELDAGAMLIPLLGFLPPDDERVLTTLDAIQQELCDGVFVHRYRTLDGGADSDGAHLLSSFWFVSCLAMCGRVGEASDRLAELCTYATPLGLFGEQINPATGEPAGNYPSASSHLAMVNASLYVGIARGRVPAFGPIIGIQKPVAPAKPGRKPFRAA